jgi:hypothetical protein
METNSIINNWNKVIVILTAAFILLSFGNAMADESIQKQTSDTAKYQALYLGKDNSGLHVILFVNTQTGRIDKRIFYDDANDHQDIFNFATKEITTITRTSEKKFEAK